MAPSETDLRAALRDGEGDGPDPESIVLAGRARAAARRTRTAAAAGAVAGVAVLGMSAALVLNHGNGTHRTVGYSSQRPAAGSPAPSGADRTDRDSGSAASRQQEVGLNRCPAAFPTEMLPGGGGTGQFGATGALFAQPVTSVLVCAYGSTGSSAAPGARTLTGGTAQALVSSLNGASAQRPTGMCEDYRRADDSRYAFIGITSGGTALAAVTTTLGQPVCSERVTNGTAIRYAWSPPADLAATLSAIVPQ